MKSGDGIYKDIGCNLAPSCLNCPLPICKYDRPKQDQGSEGKQKDLETLKIMRSEGLTKVQAAKRFGVTERTIYRILSRNPSERREGA